MANELDGVSSPGDTCYALIFNSSEQVWDGSALVTFNNASYASYPSAITELSSTGIFSGDFPVGIAAGGTYKFFVKRQMGASPAEDDPIVNTGTVDWTGTSAVSAGSGAMTAIEWLGYVLRGGFKRTDKSIEVYEETTDAIQELRQRFMFDEAEVEITSTDTIAVLGDFKIDLESDFGLLLGIVIEDGQNGTELIKVSKNQFDCLYPDINVTNDRGYPKHFTIYGGKAYIGPIPDQITYSYRESYSKRAGTITGSTTGVPFTTEYRDVLRDNVLARLYKLMDEFEKSGQLRQSFESGFLRMTRRERLNSGVTSFNVRPFGM